VGARPWSAATGGVVVSVRLTPKGGRDAVDGVAQLSDGRTVLAARVRAAPSDGAANAALVRLMAKAAGVPPGRIAIVGGTTARIKHLNIAGDPSTIIAALEKIAPPG
jgi:uncharacterized protein YggU (UPF0235/DUF167 family)